MSLPLVTPRIYASDEIEYFAYLRSMWFDRDLSFDNEYRYFDALVRPPGFYETFIEPATATGLRRNFAPMGCAILWTPFYGVGHVAALALNALGYPVEVNGYSAPYIRAVCYGSAVYGFLAILLSLDAATRVLRRPLITTDYVAALAVWWGTPLFFYMYVAPPMSHATSAFTVAAFVAAWLRVRERWDVRGFAILGVLAGLMTSVREQDAFFAIGPAIDLFGTAWRQRRVILGMLAGIASFAIVYVPQAIAYLRLNGRLGPSELVSRKMFWYAPHAFEVLASPSHGLLFWTPLAALSIAGLALVARKTATDDRVIVGACLLAMVAAQIYIAGSVESWTVAGAFGQRRFVGLTVVLIVGLAALLDFTRTPRGRTAVAAGVALATWWNIGLIVQFGSGQMDRQRLELGRITYNNFVAVPMRIPELAYRYVFARSSFYHPPAAAPDPGR